MKKISLWFKANDTKLINQYRMMLRRIKKTEALSKLLVLFENPRLKKSNRIWATKIDEAEPVPIDLKEITTPIKKIIIRDMPVKSMLLKILDFGMIHGPIQLERVLLKNKVRFTVLKIKETQKEPTLEEVAQDYHSIEKELHHFSRTLKISNNPTPTELNAVKKSNPKEFKLYTKIRTEQRKAMIEVRNELFKKENTDALPVSEYKKQARALGIKIPIDRGFKGMITKEGEFKTSTNKTLIAPLGSDVRMNKKYKAQTDDTYYCQSTNIQGNKVHHYTEEYFKKKKKEKYVKNLHFGEKLEAVREQVISDLNSPNQIKRSYATIVALVDQAYFRIGNLDSTEKRGTQGLTTLRVENLTIKDDTLYFKYVGKDYVDQAKVITDPALLRNIKQFLANKNPKDFLFTTPIDSKGTQQRVDAKSINTYLKDELKSPVTVHKFRTYHATKMAKEALDEISDMPIPELMDAFQEKIQAIADKMGHKTMSTTIKHYIDSNILQDFFVKKGIAPPKSIKNLITAGIHIFNKTATIKNFTVSSLHTITPEDLEFKNYNETLPPSILELKGII